MFCSTQDFRDVEEYLEKFISLERGVPLLEEML